MKKGTRPKLFEGELSRPIILGNRLVVEVSLERILGRPISREEYQRYEMSSIAAQRVEKAHLLARRLGIEISRPEDWGLAFVQLAEALCPGFKVVSGVDYLSQRPGAPPGRRSDGRSWLDLVTEIDGRPKGESITDACERLSNAKRGQWKGVDKLSLRARYYEHRGAHARALLEWNHWIEEVRAKLLGKAVTAHKDGASAIFTNDN